MDYMYWILMLILAGSVLCSINITYNIQIPQRTTQNLLNWPINTFRLWPKVSIIVPCHNEEGHLEHAMTSLCQLKYENYEIIAVDDRSTDASNQIICGLVEQYPHLKLITLDTLPANWLGKVHALHRGLMRATGDYIVFTDADVVYEPLLLNKAVDYMLTKQLGHLTLTPKIETTYLGMKVLMPFLLYIMLAAMRPWRIKNTKTRDAVGIGAFNCVSREALHVIGDMEHLALNPIDDMGLARSLKQASIKQGFANAEDLLKLTWYDSIEACSVGFEKNIFAFFDFSIIKSVMALIGFLLFIFLPFIALGVYDVLSFILSSVSIGMVYFSIRQICQQLTLSKRFALSYPIAAMLILYIGIRSVGLCMVRQGIYWGGVFFPLQQLTSFYKFNK